MGIVNATPDSFSDGGRYLDRDAAVEHGLGLGRDGAAVLDVGGESSRPGAEPVGEAEELDRVLPVVEQLAAAGERVSVDTTKLAVARAALAAGATIVNDVSAFRADPGMAALVAESGAGCCLVHMRGEPRTMHHDPSYGDVVSEVKAFLEERLAFAVGEGMAEDRVWLDPGIGFGKNVDHNLELLRRLGEIVAIGRPVVVGTSRKSFLGKLAGGRDADDRLAGDHRHQRDGARAGGLGVPGPRRTRRGRCPEGGRCYGRPMTSESDPNDPDDDFEELDDDDLDDESAHTAPAVTIEVNGLSLYTRHGVSAEERELGQRLVFDVVFELDECDATVTDRVEDTINYAEVCEQVALAAQERSYRTLERLCTAVADRLIDRFGAESVRVKAAKPEPPIPLPVDEVSVEVWKQV